MRISPFLVKTHAPAAALRVKASIELGISPNGQTSVSVRPRLGSAIVLLIVLPQLLTNAFLKETCRAVSQGEENPYPGPSVSRFSTFPLRKTWRAKRLRSRKSLFSLFCKSREFPGRAGPGRSGDFYVIPEKDFPGPI